MRKIRDLSSTVELIRVWTVRTLRGRYRQSLLGGLWAVIQPASAVAVFSVVFVYVVPVDTGGVPYVLFSYAAMVPWTLFSASINDMVDSLVANGNLVGKIYFPREVLPVAASLARVVDAAIAAVLLAAMLAYYRVPLFVEGLLLAPVLILLQCLLAIGIGLIGAALNVFYRDTRHLFLLGLQIWFYATPIIYSVASVPERLRPLYFLNPMAGIITAYRAVLFERVVPWADLAYPALCALVAVTVGLWFFKRVELQFADAL